MVDFIAGITKPDGTCPLIGDIDNGRLHRLKVWGEKTQEWNDFRYIQAIGALLFGRDDFARIADNQWEEAIWLFGSHRDVCSILLSSKSLTNPEWLKSNR